MKQITIPRWRLVEDPRYSVCATAKLSDLNFTFWWEDSGPKGAYLHVAQKDEDTRHRVQPRYTRKGVKVRLAMRYGKLYWLT